MSSPGLPVFLLPPRPAPRDWPLAGACAGLLLGLAELALAAPISLSAPLALLAVAGPAFGLAFAATLLGGVLKARGERPSHSSLVAWVAGLIPLAAATPLALPQADGASWLALAVLLALAALVLVASAAAARLADRAERSGTPASALLVWGATALAVAAAERALLGTGPGGAAAFGLALALVLAVAGAVGGAFAFARRRGAGRPRASFASLFGRLAALALAVIFAPLALPWLLADRDAPPQSGSPPHILVLALGPAALESAGARGMGSLARWSGIRYEPRVSDPTRALEALLTLPDGAALVPLLAAQGYATAAIVSEGARASESLAREVDARPSGFARLERELGWLTAAPWLVGPGAPALVKLGLGGERRTPAQLASDARAWLLRRGGSPTPFFLLVDFRGGDAADPAASAREEEAAVALLNHLDQAGVSQRTAVLLVRTDDAREPALRVVVRPPLVWAQPAGDPVVARPVAASEIGEALRQVAGGDGVTPIDFPGVLAPRPPGDSAARSAPRAGFEATLRTAPRAAAR